MNGKPRMINWHLCYCWCFIPDSPEKILWVSPTGTCQVPFRAFGEPRANRAPFFASPPRKATARGLHPQSSPDIKPTRWVKHSYTIPKFTIDRWYEPFPTGSLTITLTTSVVIYHKCDIWRVLTGGDINGDM